MLSAGIVKDALLSFVMVEDPYLEIDGQRVSEKVIIVCIISAWICGYAVGVMKALLCVSLT